MWSEEKKNNMNNMDDEVIIMDDVLIPVVLQNLSQSYPQKSWISMGIPDSVTWPTGINGYAKAPDGRIFQTVVHGNELFINADLKPREVIGLDCYPSTENTEVNFKFSNWVTDDLNAIIPSFSIKSSNGIIFFSKPLTFWNGQGDKPEAYYTLEQDLNIRKRFFFHTSIESQSIVVEGWLDVYSGQDMVPVTIRASYGNIASEPVLNKEFGSFSMFTGEKIAVDFRKAKGLHDPIWRSDKGMWETELASPRIWWKSRVIECFGAMLCMPTRSKLEQWITKPDFVERVSSLRAREEAPSLGIADVWQENWLAFGRVPEVPSDGKNITKTCFANLLKRLNTYGDEYDKRDYAQPPNSGQTGSQPDFGASRGELAVTMLQPWALWDYRFSVQAWMLRPYAHKDAKGQPVLAKDHPNTLLWGLAPDTRFGSDFLGWPNPIPYNEFWTGSDSQHRSDNLLFAMYALTRDPSILATIKDLVQCSLMELKIYKMYGSSMQSIEGPRGWGRPLISLAHMVSLGFDEVRDNLIEMVEVMYNNAALRHIEQDEAHSVRTLSNNGGKYGWRNDDGSPIRAWVCWEESIAVMGLWAAWRVTGNEHAKELALDVARTITKHAFFKNNDHWFSCYAVRWNTLDPGMPMPESSYTLTLNPEDNKDVYVYGMHQWLLPSLRILANQFSDDADSKRAAEIINFFGIRPVDFNDSAWWAVI